MPVKLDMIFYNKSWQPDWGTTWKTERLRPMEVKLPTIFRVRE